MKKKLLLDLIIIFMLILGACSEEESEESLDETKTTSVEMIHGTDKKSEETTHELEENTTELSIPKVEILAIQDEAPKLYEDTNFESYTGRLVRMSDATVKFLTVEIKNDDTQLNGISINYTQEMRTLELAENVEVWTVIDANYFVCIPFEDMDNYETMRGSKSFWMPLFDEAGKVYAILERYIP